jgi:hypothetical protein
MSVKREDKYALAKARRERGVSKSQERQLELLRRADERAAFNEKMGANVATASNLTPDQQGRFYEATGLENASNPQEAIKGEIINTGLSFVQIANALGNIVGADDAVARGAGNVLGRMIPYGTGTTDTNKAIDTYTKWGTGNVTKNDVANLALSNMGVKVAGLGIKGLIPFARSVKVGGIAMPLPIGTDGIGVLKMGGKASTPSVSRETLYNTEQAALNQKQLDTLSAIDVPATRGGNTGRPTKISGIGKDSKTRTLSYALRAGVEQAKKAGKNPTGQQQYAYELGTLINRTESANKRAKKAGDTGVLKILDANNELDSVTKKEFTRLVEDAKKNYPEIWKQQGIEGFDFSHRTSLGTPDTVSNSWSNISLLPRKVNVDQGEAFWSAFRYGKGAEFGGKGKGTEVIIPKP